MKTYSLTIELVQAISAVLNQTPAHLSRNVLNAMESQCREQEQAASAAELQAVKDAAAKEALDAAAAAAKAEAAK